MRKIKTVLAILIIISLATAFTGCVEDEEDDDDHGEITSIEANVSVVDGEGESSFKARNLHHSEFDFVMDRTMEDGYSDTSIYNREREAFFQSDPGIEDIWYRYEDMAALQGANTHWNNIEMIVEEIEERSTTDDFKFQETDAEGITHTFSVTNIRVNHNIPDDFFFPPDGVEIIDADPGDMPR